MPISVITFDLDNTLWDVEPTIRRAEEKQTAWLLEHRPGVMENMSHEDLWEFKKSVWKRHPELAHHMSKMRTRTLYELQIAAGYSEEESATGADAAFAVFLAERHKVELYEEALEVIDELAKTFTIGALTNGNADVYKTDAAEYFDFAFLAEDIGASKPAPDMFQAALDTASVPASEIVHVGDDPEHDVLGAQRMGMRTVWMNSRGKSWPSSIEPADASIVNLRELPLVILQIGELV